jgi:hypothetical protein
VEKLGVWLTSSKYGFTGIKMINTLMIEVDVKAKYLKAHVIHVVIGLSAAVILGKDRLYRTKGFDDNVFNLPHHGLCVLPFFLQ